MQSTSHSLLSNFRNITLSASRNIARIPHYEHHIRFDPKYGRKRPSIDVLDRFKRLNNGMWIRAHPGRTTSRYRKSDDFKTTSLYYETCTKDQCEMLDKLVTPFWLRRRHYPEDPYELYHVRNGINSPRVDEKGHLIRERPKVLMDDLTAGKYFDDR